MNKAKKFIASLAVFCLSAGGASAMTQREFVDLCRDGSPAEITLALRDEKLSPARAAGGVTPLMGAASARGAAASVEKLRLLIDAGAKVNVADGNGMTPLMYAAQFGDSPAVIRFLLSAGASREAKDRRGWTPLAFAAAKNNSVEMVNALVDAGADIDARARDGATPLLLALRGGANRGAVASLLDSGADREAKDLSGRVLGDYFKASRFKADAAIAALIQDAAGQKPLEPSRLVQLCRFGSAKRLRSALKAGSDPNAAVDGLTPLMWAARDNRDKDMLSALIDAGADVNAQDPEGRTALMYAVKNPAAVQTLMNAGARVDLFDTNGRSALEYAEEAGVETDGLGGLKAAVEKHRALADYENKLGAQKADFDKKIAELTRQLEKERTVHQVTKDAARQAEEEAQAVAEQAAAEKAELAKRIEVAQAQIAELTRQLESEKAAHQAAKDAAVKAAETAKADAAGAATALEAAKAAVAELNARLEAEKAAAVKAGETAKAAAADSAKALEAAQAQIAELTRQLESEKAAHQATKDASLRSAEETKKPLGGLLDLLRRAACAPKE
ncbi:ankyrin repeat domain-containing protein [Pyramidobacter piscolens]|uniref:ankyrin repeat domain-containing protein n=1 Tax=Pyramidobacter piscolens TaxID=638849 RepID=UPI002665E8BB|nr:ankyrin repeat domain-containing protein [Pyramidobacter piscolens]